MKIGHFVFASALAVGVLAVPASALAEQGTLSQCQGFQDQIERYTRLRRSGGDSAQMSAWQKRRNHAKTQYSRYNCRVHRGELRQGT